MNVTLEDVPKLKVVELKAALSARGLPTNGRKAQLAARLTEAFASEASPPQEDSTPQADPEGAPEDDAKPDEPAPKVSKRSKPAERSSTRSSKRARVQTGSDTVVVEAKAEPEPHANIAIERVDLEADTVTIANDDDKEVSLAGWKLRSLIGSQVFEFPEDLKLGVGGRVTVWSGKNAKKHGKPPTDLFWTARFVWNNHGDKAVLEAPSGAEASRVGAHPGLSISNLDLLKESVTVSNTGEDEVSLGGWCIRSLTGDQKFEFPSDMSLGAGSSVTVWSGKVSAAKAAARQAPPNSFHWTHRNVWNNEGDTAVLEDKDGTQMSRVEGVKKKE